MNPNFPPAASNIASQAAPRCAPASPSGGGTRADEKSSKNLRDGILAPRSITPDREGQTVSRRPSTPLSHDVGHQPPDVAKNKVEARPLRSCAYGDERYHHAPAQRPDARDIEGRIVPRPLTPSTGLDAGRRSPSARTSKVEAILAPRSATPDREGQTVPRRPSTPLGHDAGHQPPSAAKSKADARPLRSDARGEDRYRRALTRCPVTKGYVGRTAPRPLAPSMALDAGNRPAAGYSVPRLSQMGLGDEDRALIADDDGSEGPPLRPGAEQNDAEKAEGERPASDVPMKLKIARARADFARVHLARTQAELEEAMHDWKMPPVAVNGRIEPLRPSAEQNDAEKAKGERPASDVPMKLKIARARADLARVQLARAQAELEEAMHDWERPPIAVNGRIEGAPLRCSPPPISASPANLDVAGRATTLHPDSAAMAAPGVGIAATGGTGTRGKAAVSLAFHAALYSLQAFFRGVDVRSGNLRRRRAQVTIAAWRRGQIDRRRLRREAAAVRLTAWGRGWTTRGHLRRQTIERCAATTITAVIAAWMRGRIPRQQLAAAKTISHWAGFRRSYRLFCNRREVLRRWYLSECRSLLDAAFSPADGAQRKGRRRRRRRGRTRAIADGIPGVWASAAAHNPRGTGTSYADAARSQLDARDCVCTEWPRGKAPDRPVKRASRRRRRGRPRNSQRRPRHRNSGHGPGNTCFETEEASGEKAGTETTADVSDGDTGGLAMAPEDPPGENAAAISRHKRYQRASADDPRYRQYLARSHPFRNKGSWHPPSRRHRNGRRRKQMDDGVDSVPPDVDSGPGGPTGSNGNPGDWERLAAAHPFRDRGGRHRPPRRHNKL